MPRFFFRDKQCQECRSQDQRLRRLIGGPGLDDFAGRAQRQCGVRKVLVMVTILDMRLEVLLMSS